MSWYFMFIDQGAKGGQWREGECTALYSKVMNCLCIHPFADTLRKGGDSQEGLSHLSLPFSMGRWGLPVESGAAVQHWALSSPSAPGQGAPSLAKSLSPFLATLPSSPASPSVCSAVALQGTMSGQGMSSGTRAEMDSGAV